MKKKNKKKRENDKGEKDSEKEKCKKKNLSRGKIIIKKCPWVRRRKDGKEREIEEAR